MHEGAEDPLQRAPTAAQCQMALQITSLLPAGEVQGTGGKVSRHGWGSAALSVFCFEIPVQGTTDSRKSCSLGWE